MAQPTQPQDPAADPHSCAHVLLEGLQYAGVEADDLGDMVELHIGPSMTIHDRLDVLRRVIVDCDTHLERVANERAEYGR